MFRNITEEERKLIRAKGKRCEAVGCDIEIDMVEVRQFKCGGANLPSYLCLEHPQQCGAGVDVEE